MKLTDEEIEISRNIPGDGSGAAYWRDGQDQAFVHTAPDVG